MLVDEHPNKYDDPNPIRPTETAIKPRIHNAQRAQKMKEFPAIRLETVDERFTSKMAKRAMIDMGIKKKQRRDKALVDEIAATMMLQEWLEMAGRG